MNQEVLNQIVTRERSKSINYLACVIAVNIDVLAQRCPYGFEEILKSFDEKWGNNANEITYRVIFFKRSGFINFRNEEDCSQNWTFNPQFRYKTPLFSEQNPDGRNSYFVWANTSILCGGNGGDVHFACYWHNRPIRKITVFQDYNRSLKVNVISAISFDYCDGSIEEVGKENMERNAVCPSFYDKITKVSVKTDMFVHAIKFYFIDQNYKEWSTDWMGGDCGNVHTFDKTPKGIFGRCGIYLDAIGIFY